jgi:DNA-binding MurR/RpiR family transcriptional regulator
MADNVDNITHDILKNIQANIAQFRAETNERFDRLEAAMRKDRRNVTGMLVMMRATASDFDERVSEIEERVTALEGRP